mgnify:CR=1 FL=1
MSSGIVFTDTTWCFPICREDFEWRLSPQYVTSKEDPDVYAIDKDGNLIEDSRALLLLPDGNNSLPVSMYLQVLAPSEAQMEQFWKLYNSIDHVCTEDAALLDIILEQAQPYFAGDKTLDETADLIQRRGFTNIQQQPNGTVSSLSVGGVEVGGNRLRTILDLRSACFTISFEGDTVTFSVTGYRRRSSGTRAPSLPPPASPRSGGRAAGRSRRSGRPGWFLRKRSGTPPTGARRRRGRTPRRFPPPPGGFSPRTPPRCPPSRRRRPPETCRPDSRICLLY